MHFIVWGDLTTGLLGEGVGEADGATVTLEADSRPILILGIE